MRRVLFGLGTLILMALLALGASAAPARAQSQPPVFVLTAHGPLTPALLAYLTRSLSAAEAQGAAAVVLQLDTPGGGVELTQQIVQAIRASRTPVIVYVAPNGAIAASAGTLVTLAGHAAGMAPETAIGAASPIDLSGQDLDTTLEAKTKSILQASARSLAEGRGPEAVALAEATIDSARAVSASEALQAGLIDVVAVDVSDLLRQLDGRVVQMEAGPQTLALRDAPQVVQEANLLERLLIVLTNPNIVLLLLNIGVVAILIELFTPGGWVSGSIGVVCLALAAYGLGVLTVNWFGAVFLILAFALFLLDFNAPTHGALTVAGIASLMAGGWVLFNSPGVPEFQRVSPPMVIGSALATGGLFLVVLLFGLRAQRMPVQTGLEGLIGRIGEARTPLARRGQVQIGGELWSAELAEDEPDLARGAPVQVVGQRGLTLIVRRPHL